MNLLRLTPLTAAAILIPALSLYAQTAAGPSGHWEGTIQIPNHELGVTVDLARSPSGAWIGSISIPGSTTRDVPLKSITVKDAAVRFTAHLPRPTSFDGTLAADAHALSGTVSNVEGAVPFALTRNGEANVSIPPPSTASSRDFEGLWKGSLEVSGKTVRVGLKLSSAPDGTAIATLIQIDQGNLEIPVTTVTIKGNQLELESRAVSGTYRGSLGAGGDIVGLWTQGPNSLPLTLRRAAGPDGGR